MKRSIVLASAAMAMLLVFHAGQLVSQDRPKGAAKDKAKGKEKGPAPGIDMEAMMKKWHQVATPGKAHKRLEELIGAWDYKMTFWMQPGGPPSESKGTSEFKWIMGKRFVQAESTGTFFNQPYQGLWILGYDNFRKKYHSYYLDNVGTAAYTSEGTATPDGKTIATFGKMDDWMSGKLDGPVKYVIKFGTKDRWTFEIHDLSLGEKTKTVEVVYTRKK